LNRLRGSDRFIPFHVLATHRARPHGRALCVYAVIKEFVMQLAQSLTYTRYKLTGETTEQDVLAAAEAILKCRLERQGSIGTPMDASDFLRMRLGALLHEEFHVLWLDNRHRIPDCQKLFTGTVDGASIYPREVVRAALSVNACAAILAHNHPSGVAEPSAADRAITNELREALRLIGVRVLDHIVVGSECVSMADRGLI
jgi:DNA repair protein RadC